jgi:molecular chaperone GrpE
MENKDIDQNPEEQDVEQSSQDEKPKKTEAANSSDNPKEVKDTAGDEEVVGDDDEEMKTKENETKSIEEYNELYDKYIRLYSEFENYRRRATKEKLETIQHANSDLVQALLPVLDDFERAIKAMENTKDKALLEGVKLVYNKFKKILDQRGLKEIKAIGEDFDPEYHEAITKLNAGKDKKGKVIEQVEKGYSLNDKIIRYSKVVVGE